MNYPKVLKYLGMIATGATFLIHCVETVQTQGPTDIKTFFILAGIFIATHLHDVEPPAPSSKSCKA